MPYTDIKIENFRPLLYFQTAFYDLKYLFHTSGFTNNLMPSNFCIYIGISSFVEDSTISRLSHFDAFENWFPDMFSDAFAFSKLSMNFL